VFTNKILDKGFCRFLLFTPK